MKGKYCYPYIHKTKISPDLSGLIFHLQLTAAYFFLRLVFFLGFASACGTSTPHISGVCAAKGVRFFHAGYFDGSCLSF